MTYKNTEEFALQLDENDELKHYRNEFHIPLKKKWRGAYLPLWELIGITIKTNSKIYKSRVRRLGNLWRRRTF